MDSLTKQELEVRGKLTLLEQVAKKYGWEDDDPAYMKRKAAVNKRFRKLAGKVDVSTEQKGAETTILRGST